MAEPLDRHFLDFQTAVAGRYSLENELGRGGMGVGRLETDAREVRHLVDELTDMLAQAADPGRPQASLTDGSLQGRQQLGSSRQELLDELRTRRDAAQQRPAQAIAALEAIRLELLALHGGIGSVESLTADLAAAKECSKAEGRSRRHSRSWTSSSAQRPIREILPATRSPQSVRVDRGPQL